MQFGLNEEFNLLKLTYQPYNKQKSIFKKSTNNQIYSIFLSYGDQTSEENVWCSEILVAEYRIAVNRFARLEYHKIGVDILKK